MQVFGGYSPFDLCISLCTFSRATHVEFTLDRDHVLASRPGLGADCYPRRTTGLRYVLRPVVPLDVENAVNWFYFNCKGKPYGWLDLLQFIGITVRTEGVICSQTTDLLFQNGAARIFNPRYPNGLITPRDHLVVGGLELVWTFKPNSSMRLPATVRRTCF